MTLLNAITAADIMFQTGVIAVIAKKNNSGCETEIGHKQLTFTKSTIKENVK